MTKTNAIRILEKQNIPFEVQEYTVEDGDLSGVGVARKINEQPENVFKTLVCKGKVEHYVFVIPAQEELDLKKAAKVAKEKNMEMIPQKSLLSTTGYVHGGCSPIGMKKQFATFIDGSAKEKPYFIVSAGKIGMQIKLPPLALAEFIQADFSDLTK